LLPFLLNMSRAYRRMWPMSFPFFWISVNWQIRIDLSRNLYSLVLLSERKKEPASTVPAAQLLQSGETTRTRPVQLSSYPTPRVRAPPRDSYYQRFLLPGPLMFAVIAPIPVLFSGSLNCSSLASFKLILKLLLLLGQAILNWMLLSQN